MGPLLRLVAVEGAAMLLVGVLLVVGASWGHSPVDVDVVERQAIESRLVDVAAQIAPPIAPRSAASTLPGRPPSRRLSEAEMVDLAGRYFRPEDVALAVKVAWCESRWDVAAKNPRSWASGLWQHLGRFWPERAAKAGIPDASIWDPDAQARVAAWLVYEAGGWGHWYPSEHCWAGGG